MPSDLLETIQQAWEWVKTLNWFWVIWVYPTAKRLYDKHIGKKRDFRKAFGFERPKTEEELLVAEFIVLPQIEFLGHREEELEQLMLQIDDSSPFYAELESELERRQTSHEFARKTWGEMVRDVKDIEDDEEEEEFEDDEEDGDPYEEDGEPVRAEA